MLFKSLELRRLRRKIHLAWSKFDWKEECIRLHTSYCMKSIMWTICKCLIKCRWVIHRVPEHGKKSTLYLFQNDVALYFEPFWERGNVADINFWCFIKFNGKKNRNFATDQVKRDLKKKNKRFQLTMKCGWHT